MMAQTAPQSSWTKRIEPWLLLAPMLIVLATVTAWPLARTAYLSFMHASLDAGDVPRFIGFGNYLALMKDGDWWHAARNTAFFAATSVTLETLAGVGIALLIDSQIKGRGALRAVMLIPWAIPTVVSAQMWQWMLHDQYGVVNALLIKLGFISHGIAWTAGAGTAMAAIIAVDVWQTTPFMVLLILAGLQIIPRDFYEAAKVDGAPGWAQFFYITLPLLWPTLAVAILFRLLDAVRMFDLAYVLSSKSRETATISIYARQQLVDFQDVGYGSAVAMLVFLMISLVAAVYVQVTKIRLISE